MARLHYPFPSLMNPHAKALQNYTDTVWIDGEWAGFVPPKVAECFKQARTAYMTAYFFPTATWDRLIPLARMMLFSLYHDDIYERARPSHIQSLRERTMAIARGELSAADAGVMLGAQVETIRTEALRFVPEETVLRWADGLDLYFAGLEAESTYLWSGDYPSVAEYMEIREKALMIYPFLALEEVETGIVLPPAIHDDPVLRRLEALTVRIPGWFNEFQSYDKDMRTGMSNMNLINVFAHENNIDLPAAREEVFRIHDAELAEFVRLQRNLPDFSEWNDRVENHVHHLSFVISGWRGVDSMISRYDPDSFIDRDLLKNSLCIPKS